MGLFLEETPRGRESLHKGQMVDCWRFPDGDDDSKLEIRWSSASEDTEILRSNTHVRQARTGLIQR